MNEHPVLMGARVLLRLPCAEDVPGIIKFYADNSKHFEVFASPRPASFYTSEYWQGRVTAAAKDYEEDRAVNFFILSQQNQTVLGFVNFFGIIRGAFHACYLGYGLSEAAVGQGIMTEALRLAVDYMFQTRNMHRIMANHSPHNIRSASVLRRLGFVPEGYARDYLLIHGKWQDHVLNALTSSHWRSSE